MKVFGIVLTVTGVIALAHYGLRTTGQLPHWLRNDTLRPRPALIVALGLIAAGVVVFAFSG